MDDKIEDFDDLVNRKWNYPGIGKDFKHTQLRLKATTFERKITTEEIDKLKEYPDIKSVTVCWLNQKTFEYFITNYGKQFTFIEFFKCPLVEDWSLLEKLPDLECVKWFWNQRINKFWNMSKNYALKAIVIEDFTKLHSLDGIETSSSLEWLEFGDAIWRTSNLDSLKPLRNTKIKHFEFHGNKILDMDVSIIPKLKYLEVFDFPTNIFTTEQVAWLVAKCPNLAGWALRACIEKKGWDEKNNINDVPAVIIVGKRKPFLIIKGNEKRIQGYIDKFDELVEYYKNN